MICHLFKQKRRINGQVQIAKNWSGRLQLPWESKVTTIGLGVSDQRRAMQRLMELRDEREMEHRGLLPPKTVREAASQPLLEHLEAFLSDVQARGRSDCTAKKYRSNLKTLFAACKWRTLADVTPKSFTLWRASSGLSPKSLNDMLATASGLMEWLRSQHMLRDNPLEFVHKVDMRVRRQVRRALSQDEAKRLLETAPHHRAVVYLTVLETGLRRKEMDQLRLCDFLLEGPTPFVRVPASIAKNRRDATIPLRPELVEAVRSVIQPDAMPFAWVFRGLIPRIPTMKKDLIRAGIPFQDAAGRRVDLHSLRMTFGTNLSAAGVQPRTVMELMRHSDIRLTMTIYTDAAHLPLASAVACLPILHTPKFDTENRISLGGR